MGQTTWSGWPHGTRRSCCCCGFATTGTRQRATIGCCQSRQCRFVLWRTRRLDDAVLVTHCQGRYTSMCVERMHLFSVSQLTILLWRSFLLIYTRYGSKRFVQVNSLVCQEKISCGSFVFFEGRRQTTDCVRFRRHILWKIIIIIRKGAYIVQHHHNITLFSFSLFCNENVVCKDWYIVFLDASRSILWPFVSVRAWAWPRGLSKWPARSFGSRDFAGWHLFCSALFIPRTFCYQVQFVLADGAAFQTEEVPKETIIIIIIIDLLRPELTEVPLITTAGVLVDCRVLVNITM